METFVFFKWEIGHFEHTRKMRTL